MQNRPLCREHESQSVQRPSVRRNWRLQSSLFAQLKQFVWEAQNGRPFRRMKHRPFAFRGQGTPCDPLRDAHESSRIEHPLAAARARQRPTRRPTSSQFPEQQLPVPTGRQGLPLRRHERAAATPLAPPKTAATPAPAAPRSSPCREVRHVETVLAHPSNRILSMLSSSLHMWKMWMWA